MRIGPHRFDCTLGRAGVIPAVDKREGDGKTPLGQFSLRQLLYRADRVPKPETGLTTEVLTPTVGWCEDPTHPDYNKKITLPYIAVHDRMTRDDHLYDYTVVIGYNDNPPVAGKGSAIFMHLARPEFAPTAGCVGLCAEDMVAVLRLCDARSQITILSPADSRT
ncbi:MAG: L,D-transpeptidase family protein [Proteobacteria bacterium]|nr:L,D-transpeptidase family protein [Pseudomonadota bacterium]